MQCIHCDQDRWAWFHRQAYPPLRLVQGGVDRTRCKATSDFKLVVLALGQVSAWGMARDDSASKCIHTRPLITAIELSKPAWEIDEIHNLRNWFCSQTVTANLSSTWARTQFCLTLCHLFSRTAGGRVQRAKACSSGNTSCSYLWVGFIQGGGDLVCVGGWWWCVCVCGGGDGGVVRSL